MTKYLYSLMFCFFFSSRRRHTRFSRDWSSDVCSSDLDKECTSCKDSVYLPFCSLFSLPSLWLLPQLNPQKTKVPKRLRCRLRRLPWLRSEERRVGKECRARRSPWH